MARHHGRIVRLEPTFGFVASPNGDEYFLHPGVTCARWEDLRVGQRVDFDELVLNGRRRASFVVLAP